MLFFGGALSSFWFFGVDAGGTFKASVSCGHTNEMFSLLFCPALALIISLYLLVSCNRNVHP